MFNFNPVKNHKYDSLTPPPIFPLTRGGVTISWASHTPPQQQVNPICCALAYDTRDTWNSFIYGCASHLHSTQGQVLMERWAQQSWSLNLRAELASLTSDGSLSVIGESSNPGKYRYLEGSWEQIGQDHNIVKGRRNPNNNSYIATFPTRSFAFGTYDLIIFVEGIAAILSEQDWSTLISMAMSPMHSKRRDARSLNLAKVLRDLMIFRFPLLDEAYPPRATVLTVIYCYK